MQPALIIASSCIALLSIFSIPGRATELKMSTPSEMAFNMPDLKGAPGGNSLILVGSKTCTKPDGTTSTCDKTCNAGETFYGNCDSNGNATCECRNN